MNTNRFFKRFLSLAAALVLTAALAAAPAAAASEQTAALTLSAAAAPGFSDVSGWYADAVNSLAERGIMSGYSDGTFHPGGQVTRGMFVTILFRLSGESSSYVNSFSDVKAGSWYENAIAWAAANGISQGVGGQRFAPDRCITREQFAVMLWNYAKYKGLDVSIGEDTNILSYNDSLTISDFAFPGLQWACGAGILNGDTQGNLNPHLCATRAQVAVMLQRFLATI